MYNTINSLVSQAIDSPDYFSGGTSTPSGNVLSGNIMAGASWNSTNTALQQALTQATGQPTQNFAVPGSTTSDTLKQLNDFIGGGGSFAPNSTVFLQAGGVDFLNGVDKGTIKDNLNNIVSTLGDQGVKVVLTGSPYATSIADVQSNNFNPEVDPIYRDVASANKNVALVDTMGNILQNKSLLRDALHTNEAGTSQYNADVLAALSSMNSSQIGSEKIAQNAQPSQLLNAAQTSAATPTMSTAQAIASANTASTGGGNVVDKLTQQILATSDPTKWSGQGFGSAQANAADMAKILAQTGITDISQFGQVNQTGGLLVSPQYQYIDTGQSDENGPVYTTKLIGYTDSNGNAVDPSKVTQTEDGSLITQGVIGTTYGNKLTGQAVPNTYSERQTGNAFGGTFAGSGNTGYRVNFDAQGNPQFYTTGASSSNLKDFAPLLAIGGLALGAPYLSELFGGAAAAEGLAGAAAAGETIAGTGMTLSELAQLDMSLGGAGGTAGALEMASALGGDTAAAAAADAISGMGGGTGLTQTGTTALADMGGGTGLLPSSAANLEALGGGQGLTTAGAGGGILGATGLNTGAGLGSTLGTSLANLNTGVTGGLDTGVAGMGGGTGITANNTGLGLAPSTAANLEAMGGAQGLTTAGAGGGILGATGLDTGLGVLGGSTLGSTLAGLNTGVASGLGGTTGVTGMGTGTGLTAGAAGLGLNAGTAGLGAEGLGAGLTGGALDASNSLLGGAALGSTLGGMTTGALGSTLGGAAGGALGSALGGGLGSTLAGVDTGVGAGLGAGLGAGAGTAAGTGLGSALGTSLATGLGLNALGNVAGSVANQQAISQARDLINQYGAQARTALSDAYRNAQGLNTANRTDLGNLYQNTSGNLQNLYNQQVGYQAPYQQVGQSATQGLIANQPYFTHQFDVNDLNTNLAPNYAFQLQQGQMANQRAANAAGGALGGNALQGLQKYTQDYAGNAYQQAFNNYNTQRNNIYNSLAGMAGLGQTSTGQLANLGNAYGSNMAGLSNTYGGNLTTNAGQGITAANAYGLNQANLATGLASALAGNAVAGGANTANALSTLGNTALLGSMIKAT